MNRVLSVISLVAIAAVVLLWSFWRREHAERQRLQANQNALLADVEFYRTESGKSAAVVERLTMTVGEFRRHFDDYRETLDDLGIRLRRVESMSRSALRSDYRLETVVRDSVVIRERADTLKVIGYCNPYMKFSGIVDGGTFRGTVATYDTIDQVVHRVPRKFLFFRYGTKAIRQEVVTRNPYSQVTYTEYIKLNKRNGKD